MKRNVEGEEDVGALAVLQRRSVNKLDVWFVCISFFSPNMTRGASRWEQ